MRRIWIDWENVGGWLYLVFLVVVFILFLGVRCKQVFGFDHKKYAEEQVEKHEYQVIIDNADSDTKRKLEEHRDKDEIRSGPYERNYTESQDFYEEENNLTDESNGGTIH